MNLKSTLSGEYRRQIIDFLLLISIAVELILLIVQVFAVSEGINLILFFNAYIAWSLVIAYCLANNIYKHFLLFSFYACFFVFLMGQKIIVFFRNGEYSSFLTFVKLTLTPLQYITFTFVLYSSIVGVFLGYRFAQLKLANRKLPASNTKHSPIGPRIQRVSLILLIPSFLCALIMQIMICVSKGSVSYTESYLLNVDIPIFIKIGNYFFFGLVMIFLATRPPKKALYFVLPAFLLVNGVLQLFIGRRALIAQTALLIVFYLLVYSGAADSLRARKKHFFAKIALIGLLGIFLFWFVEKLRSGYTSSFNPFTAITKFMTSTGGSDSVIAHTIDKTALFPSNGFAYLLNPIKDALINNPVVQLVSNIFGITATTAPAQSLDVLLKNNNFSHWISYLVHPHYYLTGHGMGSSYIAETYLALGVLGPTIISGLVGLLIYKLSTLQIDGSNIYRKALSMCLIFSLFSLPRSGVFEGTMNWVYCFFSIVLVFFCVEFLQKWGDPKGRLAPLRKRLLIVGRKSHHE